ncbi:protein of unknown function [Amycolatopsis arida]|uniref:DUF397 domain-containing protein n=1 Tax=Amycolatopsis arida TaxID=587909 RepID=A0A1I5PSL2_9PSEU|nr:DUF397 domain-containing protein [Amycolatopsis arida]TDX98590.1 uncharacterized protein DUF397 [Amycolatopsis arida]SFP36979.1 protein of unknown function [Amycolatopsis arida]
MPTVDLCSASWRKSSHSTTTSECVEVAFTRAAWRKSSHSTDQPDCVEVAFSGPAVGVRDSKNPRGGALVLPAASWRAFLERVS